jgi:tripartite-type tricarboxylate transporter receptor subunit TctC
MDPLLFSIERGRKMAGWKMKLVSILLLISALAPGAWAAEESFPTRPLELVVPFTAGGSTDVMARNMVADAARFLSHQPVVVVNKAGGGTIVASRYVLEANRNDGYTLYCMTASSGMIAPMMHKADFTWRDFIGIAQIMLGGDTFYVRADAPFKTLAQFIEYAKQHPGEIKYATAGAGTSPHLAMSAVAGVTGINIKHIPTKGDSEAITAVLGGHVVACTGNPISFQSYVTAGKLLCLAQFGEKRYDLPDVPTLKEQGIDVVVDLWRWVVVPKNTPAARVKVLGAAFKNILLDKTTSTNLQKIGVPVAYLPPEEYEGVMKNSEEAVTKVMKYFKP